MRTRDGTQEGLVPVPAAASGRVKEATQALREKDTRATTLGRLRLTREADGLVRGRPQPLQLGEGLYFLLDNISLPVHQHDLLLGRISEEIPDEKGEELLRTTIEEWGGRAIPPWMRDSGHECFAWDRLLFLGLPGLENHAKRELGRRRSSGGNDEVLDFLKGAVRVYQAYRSYARRYANAAGEAGLDGPAANCAAIAERAPGTFAETLQLIWLVGHVFCTMLAMNPTLTFGRMDELLLPFYRRDLREGRLSREEAGVLIEDLYCKMNLILGRGEHQMSHGSERDTGWHRNLTYDAPLYVILGGRRHDGSACTNDLTELFVERVVPRFENPVVVFRYTPDVPAGLWELACRKMRENASFMVYNDECVVPAMVHCGIEEADAVTYTMHGCNWPDIPGIQRRYSHVRAELPRYLLETLAEEGRGLRGIDGMYEGIGRRFRREIGEACGALRAARRQWDEETPGILRVDDCFLDGPVDRARSWECGGVKYREVTCAIWSLATAADSLAAVDELVFRGRKAPLGTLRDALSEDFEGFEDLRRLCLNAPKFGQDDERADRHAVRLLSEALEEIDRASRLGSDDEVVVFRCLETDMAHIRFGRDLGATPDGRSAGQPTSENTSPYPGSARNGTTAMFRSVAKLPLDRINSGALNVRMQPGLFVGEEGLTRLASLLRTFFDMGGLQVQLSFADVEELRDAQRHPEQHRDLMVRITGYSAAFVDMCADAQNEIIRREEMGN